MSNLGVGFLW